MSQDKFAKDWGKKKFVPKARQHPRTNDVNRKSANPATPWKHFKNEILEKQREEQNSNAVNMNTAEAQEMLQKREQNYRRSLITSQAKQQPTKWEKFEDESNKEEKKDTAFEAFEQQRKKKKTNPFSNDDKSYAGIDLKNFDSKKLSIHQKNTMRKVITKGFTTYNNLRAVVKDLKYQKKKFKKPRNS